MYFLKKIVFFLFLIPFYIFSFEYDVKFSGLKDKQTLEALNEISDLISLQKYPPKTINALRFRANNDKINMVKIMQSYGFYDAEIKIDIEEMKEKIIVYIFISPGSRYLIKNVKIYNISSQKELDICNITLEKLNLPINSYLITQNVLQAQNNLLLLLSKCGYPLAKIENRKVKIDPIEKNGSIEWFINTGSLCKFGKITISGLKDVKQNFIENKIQWKYDEIYNSQKVAQTQQNILKTNLFSSVAIIHDENVDEHNHLNINIKIIEALHKHVTTGINYATIDGFGFSLGWGNRNFRSIGDLLAIEANIAQKMHLGELTYKKSDFLVTDQEYVLRFEASREKIPIVYLAFNYILTNRIDKKFSKKFETSFGITAEYNDITHSANNGKFALFGIPIFLKYTTTSNLLNPTQGFTIIYRANPYKNVINSAKYFFKQSLIWNIYIPFEQTRTIIIAIKMQFGSIIGPNVYQIPLTKLFLGGSDDDLRGYKYRTVSPLNDKYEPIGGRSSIYFSFEPRVRITKSLGLVPFTDLGIVSFKEFPQIHEKWFKSVGIGLRYFSFFGPLRLDIGFPLNRRSQVDPKYKIYINIGQTF